VLYDGVQEHVEQCSAGGLCPGCQVRFTASELELHQPYCPGRAVFEKLERFRLLMHFNESPGFGAFYRAQKMVQDEYERSVEENARLFQEAADHWYATLGTVPQPALTDRELSQYVDRTHDFEVRAYNRKFGPEWDLLRCILRLRAQKRQFTLLSQTSSADERQKQLRIAREEEEEEAASNPLPCALSSDQQRSLKKRDEDDEEEMYASELVASLDDDTESLSEND